MPGTLIIAEAGVNHDGSLDKAMALIDAAADARADIVKFQTFDADAIATASATQAEYQARNSRQIESQQAMLKRLTLSLADHKTLLAHCRRRGIGFLSTPFEHLSLALLIDDLGVDRLKIGSGDATNAGLLLAAARTGRPIILSTGMCTLGEVEEALGALAIGYAGAPDPAHRSGFVAALGNEGARELLQGKVTLLHCLSDYPANPAEVNLAAMQTLRAAFGLPVGFSDHTMGSAVSLAAVALGAVAIEKHLTLSRGDPGPDHAASLEADEFREMVSAIRVIEAALGDGMKRPRAGELSTMAVARKSLVADAPIKAGEVFSRENIAAKRPGGGVSPFRYWDLLGRPASRAYEPGALLEE